ncbi:MAG: fzeB, partial [Caulobacter sp.]|nr:fzeB [Caulobacter sp.]
MIHGFGAAGDSWSAVADSLRSSGFRVETPTLSPDQRTVGPPPASLAGLSLADYLAEAAGWAKALARETGDKPIVFGHSMGGLLAQKLAEAGLTSAIVLWAPASPADARGKPKLSPVFTFLNIAVMSKPETRAAKIWKTGFRWGVLNAVPAARHDAIYATTVHDSGLALANLAWPDKDPNQTAHVDAAKITVPVLVTAGLRDRTTPVEDLRLVGGKYAAGGGEYLEYPSNAHWLVNEPGTDVILNDIKKWLEKNGLIAAKPAPAPVAAKPAPAPTPAPAPVAKPAVAAAPA